MVVHDAGAAPGPGASIIWRASADERSPTAAMRPSRTPTSAETAGAPEPSMTLPLRINGSNGSGGEQATESSRNKTQTIRRMEKILPCISLRTAPISQ